MNRDDGFTNDGQDQASSWKNTNFESNRSSFNISPPTLPRSNASDTSRMFSSNTYEPTLGGAAHSSFTRYSNLPQQQLSSQTTTSQGLMATTRHNQASSNVYEGGPASRPTQIITPNHSNFQPQPHTVLQTVPFHYIGDEVNTREHDLGASFHARSQTGNVTVSTQSIDAWTNPNTNAPLDLTQYDRCLPVSPGLSSIAELSSLPSRRSDHTERTPIRIRPSSTISVDTIGSGDDNIPTQFRSATSQGSKKRNRRCRPVTSPTLSQSSLDDEKEEKSPAPQNLRGDPFRSAKVKTELCRHFLTAKGCPFGNKCNYAHGEHELKFTKLMDLKKAGLVDIEIFRTHPCSTWVATGACPFDQRCIGLHDPIIKGDQNITAWLPHSETNINSVGSGANIDKFYHERISAIYSCSPVYGYVPNQKWKADRNEMDAAWNHFCSFIWNEKRSYPKSQTSHNGLHEVYVLEIALELRKTKIGQSFTYFPTHVFCGELCMVLQKRVFRLVHSHNPGLARLEEVPESAQNENSTYRPSPQDPVQIIKVHEIAFGPVGDPSVRPVSLWFDINSSEIVPCTLQQAKHQKRSRHRLKSPRLQDSQGPIDWAQQDVNKRQNESVRTPPFYNQQPRDDATFDFITKLLSYRLQCLKYSHENFDPQTANNVRGVLQKEYYHLKQIFESLTRSWMTWAWPFKMLEGNIDETTDVPPVDGSYQFPLNDSDKFHSNLFFGDDNGNPKEIITTSTLKVLPVLIWSSFIINIQICNGADFERVKEQVKPLHEPLDQLRRLPVFRHLSLGRKLNKNRVLSKLNKPKNITESSTVMTLKSLLDDWDVIEKHYAKGNQNMSRQTINQQKDSTRTKTPDEESTVHRNTKLLNKHAQMWTRMP